MSPPSKPAQKTVAVKYEHTPPPSPEAESAEGDVKKEIDLEGINDDIVEGVIIQLQKTANRPHLVKELAAILSTSVKIVETSVPLDCIIPLSVLTKLRSSANPSAIISSRLSTYLKRPCWSALAPCPLAKELETVHPRRTYFYLTTYAHQPIPDPAQAAAASEALRLSQRTIISPSLSSAASRSDDADDARRRELSPSPEVDLSAPEFDEMEDDCLVSPPTPSGSFTGRLPHPERISSSILARNHRAASPPLEKDEKEFTQTARGMQKRQLSQDFGSQMTEPVTQPSAGVPEVEFHVSKHMDLDGDLFGDNVRHHHIGNPAFMSSPAMKPLNVATITGKRGLDEMSDMWSRDGHMDWDTRSPENIELDELDGLLDDF